LRWPGSWLKPEPSRSDNRVTTMSERHGQPAADHRAVPARDTQHRRRVGRPDPRSPRPGARRLDAGPQPDCASIATTLRGDS
jgi:hypothetical protein